MTQPVMQQRSETNPVGIIALVASLIGFVFACIPGALVIGWVLLPVAFILGIVGVCLSGKSKGQAIAAIIISIIGVIVGVVVFFTLVSTAFHDAFHRSDLSSATSTKPGTPGLFDQTTTASPSNERGSRENPFPIGNPVSNKEWQITLGTPREAGTEIASANQFNDPPKPGIEFWIVPVSATYTGDKTGNLAFGVTLKFVGADNRTYDDSCGVIPEPLSDVGDLYRGGTAKGNVCVAVPAGADGLWSLSTGFGSDPVFFSAK